MQNLQAPTPPVLLPTLGQRLRSATRVLHTEVERAGVMRRLLRGGLDRAAYGLLLRNLHAIYEALEAALQTAAQAGSCKSNLESLVTPVMWRAPALERDLQLLRGDDWHEALPLAPAAEAYVQRLRHLGRVQPQLLAAHAYVRYLGDFYGGQMLARLVAPMLQLPAAHDSAAAQGLAFYRFEGADTVDTLKARFRQALDLQAGSEAEAQALVQEACSGFVQHRELFEQLDRMAADQAAAAAGPGPGPLSGPVNSRI